MKKSVLILLLLPFVFLVPGCRDATPEAEGSAQSKAMQEDTTASGLLPSQFRDTINGDPVQLFTLTNKNGLEATVTNYGLRLVSLMVPDQEGNMEDIVLGFDNLAEYQEGNGKYYGSVVGRYANRIGGARFSLDGKEYELAKNNGENHLHGGRRGFESVVWQADSISSNSIRFSYVSPDMEEGYPGKLEIQAWYTLTDANEFTIAYEAVTDKKTHINLSHHSYFNLKGAGSGEVTDHQVQINASRFTPVDAGLIPTGELRAVQGTPFDFREPKILGRDLETENEQLETGGGYDHNFVLNEGPQNEQGLVFAARVSEAASGRVLEVYTDEPGLQLYGGNFMDGSSGKKKKAYAFRGALCLETQHYPDSPNKEEFPSTVLAPGQTFRSHTSYKFSLLP